MILAAHTGAAAVPFGGTLTFKRFLAVRKAVRPFWAHPLVAVACLVWLWNDGVVSHGSGMTALLALLAVDGFVAGVIGLGVWAALRFLQRRQWRRMTALHGAVAGAVDADGIGWDTALVESRYAWVRIVRVRVADDLILLHYTPRCALYFPREFFADEAAWDAFRALVRTHAPRA